MLDGKRHGNGVLINHKGDIYRRNFINGSFTGYGEFISKTGFKY
jgi:hypothetical protein